MDTYIYTFTAFFFRACARLYSLIAFTKQCFASFYLILIIFSKFYLKILISIDGKKLRREVQEGGGRRLRYLYFQMKFRKYIYLSPLAPLPRGGKEKKNKEAYPLL